MISFVKGKILENSGSQIIVLTSAGIGYEISINSRMAEQWPVGNEAQVMTYMSVRENAVDLYGFFDKQEKKLFEMFLLVSGIGPKTALHLLSLGTVGDISSAIARGDLAYLTNVSGIGKKTAERIMVELKNKISGDVGPLSGEESGGLLGDVVEGLIALGYSQPEAREAVKKLDVSGKTSEQLMKEALQMVK